jgi:hypothetical protein
MRLKIVSLKSGDASVHADPHVKKTNLVMFLALAAHL